MDHHRNIPTRLHSQQLGRLDLNDVTEPGDDLQHWIAYEPIPYASERGIF
jgi:hypothetical protein